VAKQWNEGDKKKCLYVPLENWTLEKKQNAGQNLTKGERKYIKVTCSRR
jgi:hypothetical protein